MTDFPSPPGEGPGRVPPPAFPPTPPLAPPPPPVPPGALRPGGGWGEPPEGAPPPRREVPVWVVVAAVVAAMSMLGAALALVIGGRDGGDEATGGVDREQTSTTAEAQQAPPTSPSTTAPAQPVPEADLEAVIDEIQTFVAQERGLPYLRDVTVQLADEATFQQRLLEDFDEDLDEIVTTGQLFQALGLVEPGTDLVEALRSLLASGALGFYDPETDELVVRGTSASPYVRSVIAHELTHALDDQHFELDRPTLEDLDDESAFGFTALVEGNAVRVEQAYRATFTDEEEAQASAEELAISLRYDVAAIPISLFESILAPYIHGPALIDAILDAGGQARLDATFAAPPTTSEALLDPATFIDGQAPVPVPPPVADGAETDRGMMGALGLAEVLGETAFLLNGIGDLSEEVEGWGGDAYVTWLDGDRACVRANLVGDTPEDTTEIAGALEDFAASPPFAVEASVTVGDVVTLTSCG